MRLAVFWTCWLWISAMAQATLDVTELLPAKPFKAVIKENSWRRKNGHCIVFVEWSNWSASLSSHAEPKRYFVGLRRTSEDGKTTKSLTGCTDFQASDMNTVKEHLAFTINYLADKLKNGENVPKTLLPLLNPPVVYGEEDEDEIPNIDNDDDGEEDEAEDEDHSRKRRRAPPPRFVPSGDMRFQVRRDQREAKFEEELLGPLNDPRIFLEAAVNSDPEEKIDGIEKNLTAAASKAAMEAEAAMEGLLADIETADEKLDVALVATEMAQSSHAATAAKLRSVMAENAKLKSELAGWEKSEIARKREEARKQTALAENQCTLSSSSSGSSSSSSSSQARELSGDELSRASRAAYDAITLSSNASEINFNKIIMHLLNRPLVRKLCDYSKKLAAAKVDSAIANRLVDAIKMLKDKCNNTEERIAYEAVLVAVAPSPDDSLSAFVGRLKVRFQTLKKKTEMRQLLDAGEATACWFHKEVAPNARAFVNKEGCKQKYDAFWIENTDVTNVDPSTGSKITKHSKGRCWHKGACDDECEHHHRYLLQVTLEEAWDIFQGKCPGLVASGCGRSVFFSLVPWWVKKPKGSTCNCIYHTQAQLLISCYRHVMIAAHKDCDCDCEFCGRGTKCGPALEVLNSQAIFDGALCAREKAVTGGLHNKASCVLRTCKECGPSGGKVFPLSGLFNCPLSRSAAMCKYKKIETEKKTTTVTTDGEAEEKSTNITVKKEKESTRKAFTELLEEYLVEVYLPHRTAAHFNAEQFDAMIDGLKDKPDDVVMLMDFGMNYSHVHPDETQGEFWTHVQTTVLPIIVYRLVDGKVWAESYVFLSDDLKHDNDFVRHCVEVLVEDLKGNGAAVSAVHFWSDGCGAQFKLQKQFYFVSQPEIFLPGGGKHTVKMAHYFFCSCHGKGPSDAETGVTKTKGRTLENNNKYMARPIDFYHGVKEKLEDLQPVPADKKQRHSLRQRKFYFVERQTVARVATKGIGMEGEVKNNHAFWAVGQIGRGKRRWMPCACSGCFSFDPAACKQPEFNRESEAFEVSMDTVADTRSLDEMLTERTAKLSRRMNSSTGGGEGSAVALFLNAADDEAQWTLAEVAENPRKRKRGDVIHNLAQRKSDKDGDMVVKVFKYERVDDPEEGKDRSLFKRPKEKCSKWSHQCKSGTCDKWHAELEHAVSIREFLTKAQVKKDCRDVTVAGEKLKELGAGISQKIDQCCADDEAFHLSHNNSYLRTYKKIRTGATTSSSSSSAISSSR